MERPRRIELLAPAKNADIAIAAIAHGADAVYIGANRFGARASAGNPIADIARAVDYAHRFNARVYATVNTILYDNELADAGKMIRELYNIGVDALIVQDMGILRLDIPPIALHASTQCDTRTVEKARFLEAAGFSQIVLARELSESEIRGICRNVSVPIECFVHGALCVSYSGRCHASCAFRDRSANRGECAQLCRLPYDLTDSAGNRLVARKHLLSLRDFNQSDRLRNLLEAGVSSFKIEGRLKDIAYVKNVTAYYHQALDRICRENPEKYRRGASGKVITDFTPDLDKSFNRGFTHYFFDDRQHAGSMASLESPKSVGEYIGTVAAANGAAVTLDTRCCIANGDGLAYIGSDGELHGFRANRVEGKKVFPLERIKVQKGTRIYRNFDKTQTDILKKGSSSVRKLAVDLKCRTTDSGFSVEITDETGARAMVGIPAALPKAGASQEATRLKVFGKLGNTDFFLRSLDSGDTAGLFIPASVLADARRKAIAALNRSAASRYRYDYRRKEMHEVPFPEKAVSFAENIANKAAERFYNEHGVESIGHALETAGHVPDNTVVMTTRYCIRHELGCCRKEKHAKSLPDNLFLTSGDIRMSVEFDCKDCQMILRKS